MPFIWLIAHIVVGHPTDATLRIGDLDAAIAVVQWIYPRE
jgi:hypothetical protein